MRCSMPRGKDLVVGAIAAAALTAPAGAQASVPPGNLIQDPGAEQAAGESDSTGAPVPQWQTTGHLSAVTYGSSVDGYPTVMDSASIGGGANFFSGGMNDPTSTAQQFIDLSSAASEIDAGRVNATLSGYLGGKLTDVDNAKVIVSFEADPHTSDAVFGTMQIGPVTAADRNNETKLLPRSTTAKVPAGTRQIEVVITATGGTGSHNNAYADNLSLTLTVDPTAVDDSLTVGKNAAATPVDVLANDTDPDGGPKQVIAVTQPAHGTVALSGGGAVTYKPNTDYCNNQTPLPPPDTFTYTLNGGSTATVSVRVECPGVSSLPVVGLTASVSPRRGGTKKKPKSGALKLHLSISGNSGVTVTRLRFSLPRNVVLSGNGLRFCPAATINADGAGACPKGSKVGTGSMSAQFWPDKSPANFTVSAFAAAKNEFAVAFRGSDGADHAVRALVGHAASPYGQSLSFDFDQALQQPQPGHYLQLNDLDLKLGPASGTIGHGRRKKKTLAVGVTGCPLASQHRFAARVEYLTGDPASVTDTSSCKRPGRR